MLQENIYTLRRKAGLSQEMLAERLNVTRQTISKWEGGHSVPDLEKLRAMAGIFGVTLDELTGGENPEPRGADPKPSGTGLILCAAGAVCLVLLGVLSLTAPQAAEPLNESSTVTLNGSGLLMCLAAAVMAVGAWLLLKRK